MGQIVYNRPVAAETEEHAMYLTYAYLTKRNERNNVNIFIYISKT